MRCCLLTFVLWNAVSGFQSEEEELENRFVRNRQLSQQTATSYGGNTVYYNPSQSPQSRTVCRGRTGYVADTSRNCQVFYNCLPDGTVTTSTCPGNFQFDETTQCCKMPHDVNCAGLLDGSTGSGVGSQSQPTISCVGKRGFFPDIPSGCQIFYFCEPSGRSRQLSCPDGLLFNELIGCCDVVQNVQCGGQVRYPTVTSPTPNNGGALFCRNQQPGFYTNPTDCSTYYYCQAAGQSSILRCPAGQAFNEKTSSCDNDLSRCYGVQVDRNVFDCTGRNGWYQGNDPNCRLAFYCNAGLAYQHSCPVNLRWNTLSLSCESPDRVPCESDLVIPTAAQQPYIPVTYQPPSVTYGYTNPRPYPVVTPGTYGTDYFPTSRVPRPGVGVAQTYPSVTLTTRPGGGGGYGDFGTTQGDVFANPGLGIDNTYDCRGKIGYYAIQETGCSQFIYCNPEGIPHKFDCPSTLLFNNSLAVCDWPQNVQCGNQVAPGNLPSTLSQPNYDCRGKDGFYADQNRGGRIFYLCHADGIKYQYVCPSNLVFNEQNSVCDWPDYMKQGGFVPRSPSDLSQSVAVDWNGQPLDCRLRPAGFYANPTNNQVYARCTPDGTFIPMRCPQTTVFDQALGQCVFPFQLGQTQGYPTGNNAGGGISTVRTNYANGIGDYGVQQGGTYGQGTQSSNVNSVDGVNYAVQGGTYGQGTQGTNSIDGVNYAVQGGTYGQGTQGTNSIDGVNYAVQAGTYGQGTQGTNSVDGVNYAVQGGTYGQGTQGTNSVDGVNYAVQGGTYGQGTQGNAAQGGTYGQGNSGSVSGSGASYPMQNSFYGQGGGDLDIQVSYDLQGGPSSQGTSSSQGGPDAQIDIYGPNGVNYAVQGGLYGTSGQGVSQGSDANGYGYSITQSPIANQIRPYYQQVSQTGFYSSTPSNLPGSGYFNQIGGYNVQPGYSTQRYPYTDQGGYYANAPSGNEYTTQGHGTQVGYYNPSPPIQGYGNQVPPSATGGLTVGITINTDDGSARQGGTTPVVCIGRTGIFADRSTQCRTYTICRADGTSEARICNDNLVFSEQTGSCDPPQNTNCFVNAPGIMQPSVPVCMNSGSAMSTFVPDTTQSCMTFYSCERNGQGIGFRCPSGQQFNSRINACDDPRNCNCAAGNGGTINVRIPVTTILDGGYNTAYSSNNQQVDTGSAGGNNSIDLDITVRKQQQLVGTMPLVPGYDGSMYVDQSRLPLFYSDDASAPAAVNISAPDITSTGLSREAILKATEQAALLQMAAAESARMFASKSYFQQNGALNTTRSMNHTGFRKPISRYRGLKRTPSQAFGNVLLALASAHRSHTLSESNA